MADTASVAWEVVSEAPFWSACEERLYGID